MLVKRITDKLRLITMMIGLSTDKKTYRTLATWSRLTPELLKIYCSKKNMSYYDVRRLRDGRLCELKAFVVEEA